VGLSQREFGPRDPLLGLAEMARGIIKSVGSLCTMKLSAVNHEMWRSRVNAVNLIAWVGVRTTMDRLCTAEDTWEFEGDDNRGVSSRTSNTLVTTPGIRVGSAGYTFLDLCALQEITLRWLG
jgi:hypothetical protein